MASANIKATVQRLQKGASPGVRRPPRFRPFAPQRGGFPVPPGSDETGDVIDRPDLPERLPEPKWGRATKGSGRKPPGWGKAGNPKPPRVV